MIQKLAVKNNKDTTSSLLGYCQKTEKGAPAPSPPLPTYKKGNCMDLHWYTNLCFVVLHMNLEHT